MKLKSETGTGDDPEVQIGQRNGDEVEAERGTEVEVGTEREKEGRGRGKKKMNGAGERSVIMIKKEVLKGKVSALRKESVPERNQKREKVRVKLKKGGTKMKKMKGSIEMRKEIPRKRGGTVGVEVGIGNIEVEVQVGTQASIVEAGAKRN